MLTYLILPLMLLSPSLIAAAASKPTILDGGPNCEPKAGDYVIAYSGDRRMVQLRKGTVTLCGKKWVLPKEQLADVRFGVFPGTVRNGTQGGKEVRAEVNVECHFKNAPDCSPPAIKQHNKCLGGTWTFRRGNDYLFPCGTPEGIDSRSGSGSGKDKGPGPTLECGKVLNYWWDDGTPMLATCDSGYGCKAGVCDKGKGGPSMYDLKPEWL